MPRSKRVRFAGGDHFAEFEKVAHDMMMSNELHGGYGAYQVSFAGGNSGLSFGGNQMDMYNHRERSNIFLDILKNATTPAGDPIFQTHEIVPITGKDNILLMGRGKTPADVFSKDLDRVNAALSSDYGIKAINATYINETKNSINHIEKIINNFKNPAAKAFYNTDFGKALLYDYNNQYNLDVDGPFVVDYIDGIYNGKTRVVVATKEEITAPTDIYIFSDHQKFMRSTLQWAKNAALVENRIDNSLKVLKKHGLCEGGPLNLSEVDSSIGANLCPEGKHFVKAHKVHYAPSAKHPDGFIALRKEHCAKNPKKQ